MNTFLTQPSFIAFIAAVAVFMIWNSLTRRRREEATTAAEKRLEKFMRESGTYDDADMVTSAAAAAAIKPGLVDKAVATLMKHGFMGAFEGGDILSWANRRVLLAGSPRGWTGSEFIAAYALLVGTASAFSLLFLASGNIPTVVIAGVLILAIATPYVRLNSLVKTRQLQAFTELPDFLDDLVLSLSSGMSVLDEAIERILRDAQKTEEVSGRKNILVKEFGRAYREYKHGNRDREDAFYAAAERLGVPEVDNFVEGINEAYRTGSPILDALTSMSDHIYTIYEQRMIEYIEKKSVSFIIALTCIMMGVMVIIAAPIFAQILGAFSSGA